MGSTPQHSPRPARPLRALSLLGLSTLLALGACAGGKRAASYPHRDAVSLAYKACQRLRKSKLRLPLKVDIAAHMAQIRAKLAAGKRAAAKSQAEALAYACTTEARAREDIEELAWQLNQRRGRLDAAGIARFQALVRARAYASALVCGEAVMRHIRGRCAKTIPADGEAKAVLPADLAATFDIRKAEKRAGIGVEPKGRMRPMRLWGWIAAGTGAAMLVTGAVLGGMAAGQHADLEDKCPPSCPTDEIDRGENLSVAADVFFGLGSAVALTGGVLLFLDYSGALEKKGDDDKAARATSLQTATSAQRSSRVPRLSVSPTGISLSGRF